MSDKDLKIEYSDKPEQLLPFAVTEEQAAHGFMRFFSSNKLVPTEFFEAARMGNMEKQYFPVHLFGCDVKSEITAECTKREDEELDEFVAARTVDSHFSEMLMPGGGTVDEPLLRLLEPYDLQQLQEYTEDLLDSTTAEELQTEPSELFEHLKQTLEEKALLSVKKSLLKEYTNEKITSKSHTYSNITAKHALLPLWVLPCEYNGHTYRVFMNGQTGKIAGIPPKSKTKLIAAIGAAAAIGATVGQLIWMVVTWLL